MPSKKTGRLTHWGCWNYPGTAIRTAILVAYYDECRRIALEAQR